MLTAALGQLISNMATALIVIPIAVSAATELGVSARPVLMSVTVAAAAAFLTPVATPVNMMVMEPGGYRFGDYWKLGLPILLLFFAVSVFLIPSSGRSDRPSAPDSHDQRTGGSRAPRSPAARAITHGARGTTDRGTGLTTGGRAHPVAG